MAKLKAYRQQDPDGRHEVRDAANHAVLVRGRNESDVLKHVAELDLEIVDPPTAAS